MAPEAHAHDARNGSAQPEDGQPKNAHAQDAHPIPAQGAHAQRADAQPGGWLPASLSVVIPVFNEQDNARPLVARTAAAVRSLGIPFELILVDDGSRDGTLAALQEARSGVPELVVLALARNFGQTLALQAGLDRARGAVVVTMDGDLQNDPDDIPALLQEIHRGADAVSGWRVNRQDTLVLRKIPSWVANRMIRSVTGVTVHDQGCALKAYRRELVQQLDLYADMHRFIAILTMAAGARISEVPVRHHARAAGESKYGISRTLKVMVDLFTIQMLTWFREQPLRFFAGLGLPFGLGLLAAVAGALLSPSGTTVFPAVALVFGMVFGSCLMLGMLGEALIEESPRTTRRPQTIPREREAMIDSPPHSKLVSVLIPVVDGSEVAHVHVEACRALDALGTPYEILYLVDASLKPVVAELLALQQESAERVRVLQFAQTVRESAMLRAGAEQARGDLLITLPDRFSIDLSVLASLCEGIAGGYDLVFASRSRSGTTEAPHLRSRVFNSLISWAAGTRFHDIASGTRALRRQVFEETPLYGDFHRYLPILAHRLGFRVLETPARIHPRASGTGVLHPSLYLWRALDVLSVMFVSRFTRYPLRLFGGLGSAFAGVGLLLLLWVGIERLFGTPVANRPIVILATLLVGLGVQSFTIGLLGELILFFRARGIRDYRVSGVYETRPAPLPEP